MKVLFILKQRFYNKSNVKSYGLINSSNHLADHLSFIGNEAHVVTVVDDNCIDAEIHKYKPDVVIIEALWVRPVKLHELIELRKNHHIKWIVRIHSDIGYLSAETMALHYVNHYIHLGKHNLFIAPNSKEFTDFLSGALHYNFVYLPNVIKINHCKHEGEKHQGNRQIMHVGCFGALRLLKNQLFQALCAIRAADQLGKILHFHVTIDPKNTDFSTNPVLKNLDELFSQTDHMLVKHHWRENDNFRELVSTMDIGMQLSYTESFNIVTTDFINCDVPILVSDAIWWMPDALKTSTINYEEVVKKIVWAYKRRNYGNVKRLMHEYLAKYNHEAKQVWHKFFDKLK